MKLLQLFFKISVSLAGCSIFSVMVMVLVSIVISKYERDHGPVIQSLNVK